MLPGDETPKVLKQFAEMYKDFQPLYQSARLSCIAFFRDGTWLNLASRLELREFAPTQEPKLIQPTGDFFASVIDIPISEFSQVAFAIISQKIIPQYPFEHLTSGEIHDARLEPVRLMSTEKPSTFSWPAPQQLPQPFSLNLFGTTRRCISIAAYGDSLENIAGYGFLERIEPQLRYHTTYGSLSELLADLMPGTKIQYSTSCGFVLLAPMPFALEARETGSGISVEIASAPKSERSDLKVKTFFKPSSGVTEPQLRALDEKTPTGATRIAIDFTWPSSAYRANCVLFYKNHEVDTQEVGRWPSAMDVRTAVNTYFDPGHKGLVKALEARTDRGKESPDFELGVVRLLNLLGIPVTWYGRRTSQRRSDAAGYIEIQNRRIVFLCECTIESPHEKLSALKDRAQDLHKHLQGECEVRSLLFCATEPVHSDYERADEHGITLIGKNQLSELVNLLKLHVDADATLNALNSFRSSVISGFGATTRKH